ncbi:rhamnose ABC transporter substrate-binding protein [Faecalicatena contorta]|uniref:Monosaccharide ABC transporter substrate-binding protein, CUT2 family n=1 Tax=Faecalicatena contorta TaxID=39482 RepID=A0A315ZVT4_9FIRM|nr:rhamnose ABC transporter substrate-binding protein [Faecalicatena contorta]PWJ49736.1 monosaccharide ABC transporter substrate-binding protein (CUT2 family) [Faecalicatena contorta]SUQ14454.1 monosaccharide ABC transporter substrate-binding protein, CUT2 family [Faecalicatena contorta]
MKKKVLSVLLCVAMAATLAVGCGSKSDSGSSSDSKTEDTAKTEDSGKKVYAIVTKSAGNPYNEKEAEGFQEVIEKAGGECIVKHPEAATADAQVSVIQSLISQGVDSISIAANDENALQAALEEAMAAGIKVSCLDSKANPDSRQTFVNQAGVSQIGQTLMDAVYDITGGEGQWAILSATSQATNQNAWIDSMKEIMKDDKYSKLELVEVAYGDDEPQKSTDQTQALLSKYPDLKVICAPTTVGINAAAKVLQDEKSSVKLTGLGLPSEMAEYIGDDDAHSCPYMYLWNPIDVGRLSAYTSIALVDGTITGEAGDKFTAGDMGDYEVVEAADGGTEIILGAPFKFEPSNIADWKDVY